MPGFQKVYEKYSKSVYRFLLSLTGDEEMSEELLQETFYRAFIHINQFEGRSSIYTWLCQIGKNAWLKECNRKNRYADIPIEDMPSLAKEEILEEQVIRREEYRRVRQVVLKLSEPYKDVFILHAYAGIKLKEIAVSYGKTESWARVTFYRAKQQIIQEVSE